VHALRDTYGGAFFLIAAYSPKALRAEYLAKKIAGSDVTEPQPQHRHEADKLIQRDEDEAGISYGQAVRDTFPLADVFVDVSKPRDQVRGALQRFLELIFGNPFHTPTKQEHGMFHAYASALRSSAMSRQVGAALCNTEGDVLAVGTNEVPKAFGGQYWGDEAEDRRDFQIGVDSNDEIKRQNISEILGRLEKAGWFTQERASKPLEDLLAEAIAVLKGARVMSPIEYGRAVHAEMSAIMDASRRGTPVRGSILFSTTFPCHECARHIICVGVSTVYYIEPYPKSLAIDLHKDAMAVEEGANATKVPFIPFVGVAPRQYLSLFAMRQRKDSSGKVIGWIGSEAMPVSVGPFKSYFESEDWLGAQLKEKMTATQLTLI
jgi:deoxycytidylate deaminase